MVSVDVVVPCYNYARFLECSVDSVLSQRDVDVRVLIIDDVSSDNTEEVGRRLAARDKRVEFWRHEKNLGLVGTLNDGIFNWSAAPYLVALSADDALAPGALARACAVLDRHSEIGMVFGMAKIIGAEGITEEAADDLCATYQIVDGASFIERCCKEGNPVGSPSVIVRTAMQKQIGGYFAQMPHTCDMEMWMRFASFGPVGILQNVQAYYRWHGMNMSISHTAGALSDRRLRIATCRYVYDRWRGASIPGFREWIGQMITMQCREAIWLAGQAIENGDAAEYNACVAFVDEFAPSLRGSPSWRRLQIKKALGSRAARLGRTVLDFVRGPAPVISPHVAQFGWWPELGLPLRTLSPADRSPSAAHSYS